MDDDLSFGASVWTTDLSTPTPLKPPSFPPPSLISPQSSTQDSFDGDFDDFSTPAATIAASENGGDDDFGDFGDFGEAEQEMGGATSFEGAVFSEEVSIQPTPGPSQSCQPLCLTPMPSSEELRKEIDELLFTPMWGKQDESRFPDMPIRQVGGPSQVLVTPESRQLYNQIFSPNPPEIKPFNWTRSRIRRQQLIALGIPVNLDEVLPPTGGKLPTLEIRTRPISAPPGPSPSVSRPLQSASRVGTPRPSTPQSTTSNSLAAAQLRLGPRPELDERLVTSLLDLRQEDMSLLPTSKLDSHYKSLQEQTVQTSALLTYLLQTRDALQQDSETYNKLIAEMVSEAQKIKTGKRIVSRRGSAM
ncbi:hypothetical protein C8Q75DRAFT_742555 [Abortiporus biennis]|nr:hypothetical protein C8Q75DRAFT_742555 [Abortiporus biennis]